MDRCRRQRTTERWFPISTTRVQRWIDARNAEIPLDARDEIRDEIDVADRTIIVLECRPPLA